MIPFKKRLYKLAFRNYGVRDQFKIYKRRGLRLLLNYANHIDRRLITYQPFEEELLRYVGQTLCSDDISVFIDVGANIGLYSLSVASGKRPLKIIAFEPHKKNIDQLKANILINNFTADIEVYPVGLSNQVDELKFLSDAGKSTGRSRIAETAPKSTNLDRYDETTIRVINFDDNFNYAGENIYIKIDVEGHECRVIEGMAKTLGKNKCVLQVEVFSENLEEICGLMERLGFKQMLCLGDDRIYKNYW